MPKQSDNNRKITPELNRILQTTVEEACNSSELAGASTPQDYFNILPERKRYDLECFLNIALTRLTAPDTDHIALQLSEEIEREQECLRLTLRPQG